MLYISLWLVKDLFPHLISEGLSRTLTTLKKRVCLSLKMATIFFLIGYHFEEFRSQVAIRKKINFTPCGNFNR